MLPIYIILYFIILQIQLLGSKQTTGYCRIIIEFIFGKHNNMCRYLPSLIEFRRYLVVKNLFLIFKVI